MMQSLDDDPLLGVGEVTGDKLTSTYDHLGVQMQYLYVRVVKARDITGSYAEIRVGNYKETTRLVEQKCNPEWNQVFAFENKDRIQASVLEVAIKDEDDDFIIGWVLYDLTEVPKSVPSDSPLAPQWYRLVDRKGNKVRGELMLAVWWGTQADEALNEAWHASSVVGADHDSLANLRSKVYLSPKLWYLRVTVIEAQDLVPSDISKPPEFVVRAMLGYQCLRTRISTSRSINPMWNEDLMLVAAEPFEEPLILSVEDRYPLGRHKVVGMCEVHLRSVERRLDDKAIINTRWFDLKEDAIAVDGEKEKGVKFPSRLHVSICLEGGYHVMDEPSNFSSDLRPTAKQLWKKSIGVLEVRILGASGLLPMKMKHGILATTDAYCVAKYGKKWVRTRTVTDSLAPKWNEQCTWEVFDPCTVVTIGVFDNCLLPNGRGAKDLRIGKVIRIRLSTLETDCTYTHAYPLLALHPSGLKKMGEIHLAVRFTCSNLLNMMHMYSQPLLPNMHYIRPLAVSQLDSLEHQATQTVARRLGQAEPPLRKEVVEYMLDVGSDHMWSWRRSKANFFRIMGVLHSLIAALKWLDEIRNWKNPVTTLLTHIILIIFVLFPVFILPFVFLGFFLVGLWNRRWRPTRPPHVDTRLSCADNVHPDELDEEFDTFPTSRPPEIVRMRYDRFRSVSGRIQTLAGDLATHGERIQSLLSWRDPRATTLFIVFCLIAAIVLYAKPFYIVVIQTGFIVLSHPRFQHNLPLVPLNFFRRLPSKTDYML